MFTHWRFALVFVPLRAQTSNTIVNCNTGNPLLRTAMVAAANADSGGYRRTARRHTEFDGLTSGRQLPAPRTAYLIELQNSIGAAAVCAVLHTLLLFLRRNRRRRRQLDGNFTREDLNVFNYPPHLTFFHTLSFRALISAAGNEQQRPRMINFPRTYLLLGSRREQRATNYFHFFYFACLLSKIYYTERKAATALLLKHFR